jgi:hypothetical protein
MMRDWDKFGLDPHLALLQKLQEFMKKRKVELPNEGRPALPVQNVNDLRAVPGNEKEEEGKNSEPDGPANSGAIISEAELAPIAGVVFANRAETILPRTVNKLTR